MGKKVVIVGAGYAGIEAALALNKHKKKEDLEIILIEKNSFHTLLTELHEVAGNRVSEEVIRIPLTRIFSNTSVRVINDEIKDFDLANNMLVSDTREYNYDYLILAMGSTPNYFGIKGLQDYGFSLWSYEDAVRLREHIRHCFVKAAQEENLEERRKLLTFVVVGAGFTGVEMIGELIHWTKDLAREYDLDRREVSLVIADMMPHILHNLDPRNIKKAHNYLEKKGVEVLLNTTVQEVTAEGFIANDKFIATKTLIWCAGIRSAESVDQVDIEKTRFGQRVKVDEYCRTKYPNVYAVGDLAAHLDEEGKPYPAMVENAIQTAHGVALNILREIRGQEKQPVEVKMHGTMVSIGIFYTVSEILGRVLPVWLSIIMKFLVNAHYLWEITGFWGVWRYFYHEFLERRQNKWLLEKHWSTRIQAWWLTPLRIFLGWTWLYEGIKKVNEGWLDKPLLRVFFGYGSAEALSGATGAAGQVAEAVTAATGAAQMADAVTAAASGVAQMVDTVTAATGVGDAVTSATGVAAEGVANVIETLFELDILGILQVYLERTTEMIFRMDFSLMDWFVEQFIISSDGAQIFFQTCVVIGEILIGLALIAGAFTFLSAAASIVLSFSFIMTTGMYERTWWMLFAAFACMGGAGRAFGADYYLMPYLNNAWEYFWKNRKIKLFFKGAFDRHE